MGNIGEMLAALGRRNEAEDTYRALLEQNPDNLEYYRGFLRTKGFDIREPLNGWSLASLTPCSDLNGR